MNDLPRQKLGEIVAKYGSAVIENPRRCEGLLRDYAGGFRREISVLTMALEERVPLDLLAAGNQTPLPVLFGRLAQRLCDNLALSEQAARWAVYSWAYALDIISAVELKKFETQNLGQVSMTAAKSNSQTPAAVPNKIRANNIQPTQTSSAVKSSNRQTITVSTNGNGDFVSISEAVKYAAAGARLKIRPGTYQESIVVDRDVEIVGDGAREDIVVQSFDASCLQMRAEKALVRNLTLQGRGAKAGREFFAVDIPTGALVLENCDIISDSLSGAAIHGVEAAPVISNCRIYGGADSGVYFFDNARGQLIDCDIYRNANVNLAITQGANPSVKNCRIFEGGNGGIVVWGNGAAGTIEDCEIIAHQLANVGVSEHANPTLRRCKITGSRDAGVYVQQNGYGVFEECDIYANEDAEVAVSTGGNATLRRCTIHGGNRSGITLRDNGRCLAENCNIYDNADAGVAVYGESSVAIRRCNVHRNGKVAVRVTENSRASVEDSDLRGNRVATWESEYGVVIERKNNRE